jgi:hypothetical protein
MKLNGYTKVSTGLLAIILIFEIISMFFNQNDLLEVLQVIFLSIITFDAGIMIGYHLVK